jgi:hypothetical protein
VRCGVVWCGVGMAAGAVEEKVKTAVFKKGLRIAEFSRDYDKRRSGFITTTQFHRTVRDHNIPMRQTDTPNATRRIRLAAQPPSR